MLNLTVAAHNKKKSAVMRVPSETSLALGVAAHKGNTVMRVSTETLLNLGSVTHNEEHANM